MSELGAQATPDPVMQGEAFSPRAGFALRGLLRLAMPVLVIGGAAVGWWAVWLLCCSGAPRTRWSEQVILPGAIFLLVCVTIIRHAWHWQRPMRRLLGLLSQVRAGDCPIDDLALIRGGSIDALVPILQNLLHDLRRQRMELATLNREMHQRVASRTDALERVIGSLRQQATRDVMTGLYN